MSRGIGRAPRYLRAVLILGVLAPTAAGQDGGDDESAYYRKSTPPPAATAEADPATRLRTHTLSLGGLGQFAVIRAGKDYGDPEVGYGGTLSYRYDMGSLGGSFRWFLAGGGEFAVGSLVDDDNSSEDLPEPFKPGEPGHPPLGVRGHFEIQTTRALLHVGVGGAWDTGKTVALLASVGFAFGREFNDLEYEALLMPGSQSFSDAEDLVVWGMAIDAGLLLRTSASFSFEFRLGVLYLPPAYAEVCLVRFGLGLNLHF